ncbi:MAG: ferrous iron transport protein B [Fusobacteriaceae bacterium]
MIKIAFAGNPNVGKSALINAIAGSKLKVGNWPGVTVEKKEAFFEYNGEEINLIDLPGVYSLSPYTLEEKVTRDYIIFENPDIIINVIDSTNIARNLYLTQILKELNKPMVLAFNFFDEFEKLEHKLDIKKFSELMELDIVTTSALKEQGLKELMDKAIKIAKKNGGKIAHKLDFESILNEKIKKVKNDILVDSKYSEILKVYSLDFTAIKILERDSYFLEKILLDYKIDLSSEFNEVIKKIESRYDEDVATVFAEKRHGFIHGITNQTLDTSMNSRLEFTDKVDKILLNKVLGLPIFFMIMAGLMTVVFNGSAPLIDWVDGFINNFIAKYAAVLLEGTPDWLTSLVADGIIGGVGGIVVFVPLMLFLYFFLAILEESGYMSRVAFLMDKIMRSMGLNGKAFVPMIIGFGCSVPAIYATRTLEDEKSRKLTAVMAPFMSCGARLPVYGLFTAAFFGAQAGFVIMSLYLLGIVVAISTGLFLKRFEGFKAEEKALIMELPPYRIPSWKMIINSTLERTGEYMKKASTTIMAILMLLWALTYFPNHGNTTESYMAKSGQILAPILKPTGFADRWETVAAIIPSIAAKEIVVGFMAQVLSVEGDENTDAEETTFVEDISEQGLSLVVAIKDSAVETFSFNFLNIFAAPDSEELEGQTKGIVAATATLWPNDPLGPLKAYSFMAFILLVIPCVVTLSAIKQEFGAKFMGFVIMVMLVVPYIVSTLIFQIGRLFI